MKDDSRNKLHSSLNHRREFSPAIEHAQRVLLYKTRAESSSSELSALSLS